MSVKNEAVEEEKKSRPAIKENKSVSPVMEQLMKIQQELFVPKDQKNNFGNYSYRSCEDILKAVKPLCAKYGCVLWMDSKLETVEVQKGDGHEDRVYVVSFVTLFHSDSGTYLTNRAMAREADDKKGMDQSQITGAAISYSRKYALAGMFGIDNEKDADATNTGEDTKPTSKAAGKPAQTTIPRLTDAMKKNFKNELNRTGVSEEAVVGSVNKKTIDDLTPDEYNSLMARLKATSTKED